MTYTAPKMMPMQIASKGKVPWIDEKPRSRTKLIGYAWCCVSKVWYVSS